MSNMLGEDMAKFLHELLEVCIKYNVQIKGCGCYGSPWLIDSKTGKVIVERLGIYPTIGTVVFKTPGSDVLTFEHATKRKETTA